MKTILSMLIATFLAPMAAWGQDDADAFYVDPKLAQTVFAETRDEAHHHGTPWTMGAMLGVRGTENLVVESDLFRVDYTEHRAYLPTGAVALGLDIWTYGNASAELSFQVGYSSYRDSVTAISNDGVEVTDNMVLQVLPIGLRHSFSYAIPNWEFLQPQFLTEINQTWLHQSGTIDGIEASYWQTGIGLGVGAVVLADKESGFGGFTISSMATRDPKGGSSSRLTHLIGSRLVL